MPVCRPNPELNTIWICNPEKQLSNSKKEIANPPIIYFRISPRLKANSEIRKSPKIEKVFRLSYWTARLKLQAVPILSYLCSKRNSSGTTGGFIFSSLIVSNDFE